MTFCCCRCYVTDSPVVCAADMLQELGALRDLGMESLKQELHARGLKRGGSLEERARRLWAVRNMKPDEIPKKFRAKG